MGLLNAVKDETSQMDTVSSTPYKRSIKMVSTNIIKHLFFIILIRINLTKR